LNQRLGEAEKMGFKRAVIPKTGKLPDFTLSLYSVDNVSAAVRQGITD